MTYDLMLLANPKKAPLMHFLLCGKALVSGRIKVADFKFLSIFSKMSNWTFL